MSSLTRTAAPPAASSSPELVRRAELSEIDASMKAPALLFLVSAIAWLLIGTALALVSSIKLHTPGFLASTEWLTFGRTQPAQLNALVYGWGMNAAFVVLLWLLARLSQSAVRLPALLTVAGAFWNIGVTIGVVGILIGHSTSVEWLEMPRYTAPLLGAAYALIGAAAVATFYHRRTKQLYVSQWYLLAALFWFPWIYSAAQSMLFFDPARGTVQAVVAAWYAHNLFMLWFAPVGLAAIYYFLPKVLGKPVHRYNLAVLGFWMLAVFGCWAGTRQLAGGPVPAWVQSTGIAASFMLIVPVFVIALNHHFTVAGRLGVLKHSPTLRFIVFAAAAFTLTGVVGAFASLRSASAVLQFTYFSSALDQLGMYAFFSMAAFGGIYYLLPRLLLREWPSARLIAVHFWSSAVGIALFVIAMAVAGILQGNQLNNPEIPFAEIVQQGMPFLFARSIAWILLGAGHVAFAVNVGWMMRCPWLAAAPAATLFRPGPDLEVAR